MGSKQTKEELPDKNNYHILDYGYCRVWRRKSDQVQIMEEYQLTIESEQRLKSFENAWPLRTNNNLFVNVYHFSHRESSTFCGDGARGSLFTERIPHRLSEFANVKYPQIMSIMKSSIEGYSILYLNYGLFFVRSTMIGFTQQFQTKMWVHTDYSQPEPQNPNCRNLQQMFVSLVSAVQSACEYLFYNCPRFSQFIIQTNYVYFSKDFKFLLKGFQDYVQKLGIIIPSSLEHLRNFIKQPEGWEKFKAKKMYPRLISSQVQIGKNSQLIPQTQKPPIPESYFLKKEVFQPSLDQIKSQPLTPITHNKFTQNQTLPSKTKDRMLFESFGKEQIKANYPGNKSVSSPYSMQNQDLIKSQVIKKEELKFRRSSQKITIDQPKNNKLFSPTAKNRFHSPAHKLPFKTVVNEYFGQNLNERRQSQKNRFSQTQNQENFNLGRKSFDNSTDTRNRDGSMKSEISLIEDLEIQAKQATPYRQLKFN